MCLASSPAHHSGRPVEPSWVSKKAPLLLTGLFLFLGGLQSDLESSQSMSSTAGSMHIRSSILSSYIVKLFIMALLALTLGRVVLVDLSGLDIIFKIITLIILGVLFLGVSYIYNRFSIRGK